MALYLEIVFKSQKRLLSSFWRELGGFLTGEEFFQMKFYLLFWALHKICDFLKISFFEGGLDL